MKEKLIYAGRLLVATAVFMLAVLGYMFYEKTLIVWWWPVALSAAVALSTSLLFSHRWQWLTGTTGSLNRLCHLYVVGGVGYFLLLGGNYLLADPASVHREEALVLNKVVEKHNITHRSGRRYRYVQRDVRRYYIQVQFNDSTCKRFSVPLRVYNRVREAAPCTLDMQRGFLGFPVIRTDHVSGAAGAKRSE